MTKENILTRGIFCEYTVCDGNLFKPKFKKKVDKNYVYSMEIKIIFINIEI